MAGHSGISSLSFDGGYITHLTVTGRPATVMRQPEYASFPPAHQMNISEEYLFNAMNVNNYAAATTIVPAEYQHPANNAHCTLSGVDYPFWDYHNHPNYYAPAHVHNMPLYHIPAGSFPRYTYECPSYPEYVDGRSGSFSSLSSIGSASSVSSSHFSDYSTMSNPVYPDLAYHHSHQSEKQSPYALRNSPIHNSEVIDIAPQPGLGASFVHRTSQSAAMPALPAPMSQPSYCPPRPSFQLHASAPQPTAAAVPAHRHLEEQPHFAVFGAEQQLQTIPQYSFAQVDPIPQHAPQPHRFAQPTLFVDESPHQPSAPPSAELSTSLKSPALGSFARKFQRGPVSASPTVVSAPTARASPTDEDDEALLLRASTGVLRRPWPSKYEDQVFTSEEYVPLSDHQSYIEIIIA